jgi:hypothetical protein
MSGLPPNTPNPIPPDDPYTGLPADPAHTPQPIDGSTDGATPAEVPPPGDPRPIATPQDEQLTTPPPQRVV